MISTARTAQWLVTAFIFAGQHMLLATDYSWIGAGTDINWSTSLNWQGGTGHPSQPGDRANLYAADNVYLDQGTTALGQLQLSGSPARTVTLSGPAGATLTLSGINAPNNGFLVSGQADNHLVVDAAVQAVTRVDKMGVGTIEFKRAVTTSLASGYAFIFGDGKTIFSGNSALHVPTAQVSIGNGGWQASVILTNQANWEVDQLVLGVATAPATTGELWQMSDDCRINARKMVLGDRKTGSSTNVCYHLCQGQMTVDELIIGTNSPGRVDQSGGKLIVADAALPHGALIQTGGFSEYANNLIVGAEQASSISLQGGTMQIAGDIVTAGTAADQLFDFAGGTLQIAAHNSLRIPVQLSGTPHVHAVSGAMTVRSALKGRADLLVSATDRSFGMGLPGAGLKAELAGSLTISNALFNIADACEIAGYQGSHEPLDVAVRNHGILRLAATSSLITLPLNLKVSSGGTLDFRSSGSDYNRSIVVAHSLEVDDVSQAPGRYAAGNGFITGIAGASVVVPRIWTGAGDGLTWEDPANWSDGVAPDGATESADLSRATKAVRLNSDIELTCLIYNPQGQRKSLTITGSGRIGLAVTANLETGIFLGRERELILDVDLYRTAASDTLTFAITGGGELVIKKGFPSNDGSGATASVFSIYGKLIFAGNTDLGNTVLGTWRHEYPSPGSVTFAEGCNLNCLRVINGPSGFYGLRELHHDGGNVTCDYVLWTTYNGFESNPFTYFMRKGTLAATTATGINLGVKYTSNWESSRRSGGSFVMTGGTVTTARLAMGFPDNLFDLQGGVVNLGAGGIIATDGTQGRVALGGVVIKATDNWSSTLDLELSGTNGPAVFDTAGKNVTLHGSLTGPGGLVKQGNGTLTLNGANSFSGALVVAGGSLISGVNSDFTGLGDLVVTNGTLILNGTVQNNSGRSVIVGGSGILTLAANTELEVEHLWLNGQRMAPGSYTFGSGAITVTPAGKPLWSGAAHDGNLWSTPANWENTAAVPDGAEVELDLTYSQLSGHTQIVLDTAPGITLGRLKFDQGLSGNTLEITCPPNTTNCIAWAADGVIEVGDGQVMILDCNLWPAGDLYKKGLGTLVLQRRLWSDNADAAFYLYIQEGRVINQGEIATLTVQPTSPARLASDPEFIMQGEHAAMRGMVVALPGYDRKDSHGRGVVRQHGGIVESTEIPKWLRGTKISFMLGGGAGAEALYQLTGGWLSPASGSGYFTTLSGNYAHGTFEQSGGTSTFHNCHLTMPSKNGVRGIFQLTGGRARLAGSLQKGSGNGVVRLGGGTLEMLTDGLLFEESVPVELMPDQTTTICQAQEAFSSVLDNHITGRGSLLHAGPGLLTMCGLHTFAGELSVCQGVLRITSELDAVESISVAGGALELLAAAPALTNLSVKAADATVLLANSSLPLAHDLVLNLCHGGVTELDFSETVTIHGLTINDKAMSPGLYGGEDSQAPLRNSSVFFTGPGTLLVMHGPPPAGTLLLVK